MFLHVSVMYLVHALIEVMFHNSWRLIRSWVGFSFSLKHISRLDWMKHHHCFHPSDHQ